MGFKSDNMASDPMQIIRVGETPLDGTKKVRIAIRRVRGISFMMANALMRNCHFADKKLGELSEHEFRELENMLANPAARGMPVWMFNRRKDPKDLQNRHIISSQLDFIQKNDINEMKKLRSYKGVRHSLGLPVRGQRTRSSFREGSTVGVKRDKAAPKPGAAAKGDKK
jgi:small subunit ribosomal protein S13